MYLVLAAGQLGGLREQGAFERSGVLRPSPKAWRRLDSTSPSSSPMTRCGSDCPSSSPAAAQFATIEELVQHLGGRPWWPSSGPASSTPMASSTCIA